MSIKFRIKFRVIKVPSNILYPYAIVKKMISADTDLIMSESFMAVYATWQQAHDNIEPMTRIYLPEIIIN